MVEEISEIMSSQESLLLSQETFQVMWNSLGQSVEFTNDLTSDENLPSSSGMQNQVNQVKLETQCQVSELNQISTEHDYGSYGNELQRDAYVEDLDVLNSIFEPEYSAQISNIPCPQSSLPASQTWPGEYNFTVSFGVQDKNTKGVAWTYSTIRDKLYVKKDAPCPINFSADAALTEGAFIRVMALYTSPEQAAEVVHRCVNHSMVEIQNDVFEAEHLIRCESTMASYQIDSATKHHSVVVPFEQPPAGQGYSTYIYKFTCFGSCSGGPNRRPLMLIFTLERGNQVIGRRKLDVKICACPGRDRKTEEKQDDSTSSVSSKRKKPIEVATLSDPLECAQSLPLPKKAKVSPSQDGYYSINIKDEKCYEFLLQMEKFYSICQMMKNLSPDLMKALLYLQKKRTEGKKE